MAVDMYKTGWWKKDPLATCTVDELLDIIVEPSNGHFCLPKDAYNEVYPNVYISDSSTALSIYTLRLLGVTHVLNAAMGKVKGMGCVNTTASYYKTANIKFLGVEAIDVSPFRLEKYFNEAAEFIGDALNDGGCVLVHCQSGISRSTTLVVAFLMLKKLMSVREALTQVRQHRQILPNDGFLKQLCDLNSRLHTQCHKRSSSYR
ncbi:Dual specificity protein phosphatase 3 [Nymphon striatum]|nr:Dual specificity protein phosphatase 3 [Nymphon striatum]